jgi:chondroitin 4-sulfotransferase 11
MFELNGLCNNSGVEFPEFVRIVIESWRKGRTLDKHWRPQHELCQPCYFAYDFIGHYETLYTDADKVLTRLNSVRKTNVTVVENFPRNDPDNDEHQRTRELMKQYYSQIPDDHIRQLYEIYSIDYEMFGFQHPYAAR